MKVSDIYNLLKDTYWLSNRKIEAVEESLKYSLCIGAFDDETKDQIGFVRALTDYATVYYVADMVVHPGFRRIGIGRDMMKTLIDMPQLKTLRGILITRNPAAEQLYKTLGFIVHDTVFMEKFPE